MESYIALLRGVNVGGKNKVPMPALKAALEEEGFAAVRTYIGSGNVLFYAGSGDAAAVQRRCRRAILERFALEIPVAVISAGDYAHAFRHMPEWWGVDPQSKHSAIFVIPPADAAAMVEEVGSAPEYERVAHSGQVIFWSAPIRTFSRTRWSKVIGTPAYNNITIRNANTAKRLLQLSQEG